MPQLVVAFLLSSLLSSQAFAICPSAFSSSNVAEVREAILNGDIGDLFLTIYNSLVKGDEKDALPIVRVEEVRRPLFNLVTTDPEKAQLFRQTAVQHLPLSSKITPLTRRERVAFLDALRELLDSP